MQPYGVTASPAPQDAARHKGYPSYHVRRRGVFHFISNVAGRTPMSDYRSFGSSQGGCWWSRPAVGGMQSHSTTSSDVGGEKPMRSGYTRDEVGRSSAPGLGQLGASELWRQYAWHRRASWGRSGPEMKWLGRVLFSFINSVRCPRFTCTQSPSCFPPRADR